MPDRDTQQLLTPPSEDVVGIEIPVTDLTAADSVVAGPAESGLAESGLAESGLAESGLAESGLAESVPAERVVVRGTCPHDCPDSCGWEIEVTGGKAVKIRGAAEHPFSAGELCPKVNRLLDRVYHPDRILTPLRRVGPKGSGQFEPISWDDALAETAERLTNVIEHHGGESIIGWGSAGTQGLIQMSSLDRRFFARIGASRQVGALCGATAKEGYQRTYGDGRGAEPTDVQHSKLVILWGTNTRLTNRHLWPFVERARANGARLVVIDPIRTVTADLADQFVQPLPGTDTALVLAIAHVLIRDGMVDNEYVEQFTEGFGAFAESVLAWTPEVAAAACGIEPAVIEGLAQEYGSTRPAMIRTLIGAEHYSNGAMFFRALGVLPLLTGSWRDQGGGLARSVRSWAGLFVDDSVFDAESQSREVSMCHLGSALTDPEMAVHAAIIWNGNPVITAPGAAEIRRGLEREDLFTVVSEQFMTDTARYADIVFPATTQVEQLDVVPAWGHLYLGWNNPAIAPVGEAVPNTELWRRLARAMGLDDPQFNLTDEELLRSALHNIDVDALRAETWTRLPVPDVVLPFAEGGFATTSGRASLFDDASLGGQPTYSPPSLAEPDANDLVLLTPKRHTRFLNSSYSGAHAALETSPSLEMCESDADQRGLIAGETVRVSNARAALDLPLAISDRLRPGVVAIPWGWWGRDLNVNMLTSDVDTDWGGGVGFNDTKVTVSAVPAGTGASTGLEAGAS